MSNFQRLVPAFLAVTAGEYFQPGSSNPAPAWDFYTILWPTSLIANPSLLAGIATGYYVVAPEYAPGGAGAEVIPPEQRKGTPVPPISSSSAFDKVSPPMTANAGQKDLFEDKAVSTDSFGTLSGRASQTNNFKH
ncbi:hypothetical protein C349_01515 [Cryptococcus neoformans var. grubii Br795]|uniref:Uncharacterized protein n=1 Tax=Cryptococcus neoformans Tu259-1 TaxID=1230072 RepID=A0A854QK29_CRYNE|nr:hypothetical protein C353_01439 [Cryptococcus neoformans var. grubii AD1-83a]OWZ56618.1 hypothetical protein C368_02249 [Cryptococcus neoformans var. grubii 125.91]OXG26651.1 hypothetical protein C361_01412 [Cryptococcus neoformans var. grubii Tu259-1]OXG52960.1 hypothetical protein C355_01523 [Cryptococcus neoformans var. grubii Th84]OXG65864.1 hypothetical protein C354_01450 [Cryptococcus neoformans var. grubii MW-RSA1955]OXG67505.1 hypothetical protein C351_01275 [Cryptococcus neoformans